MQNNFKIGFNSSFIFLVLLLFPIWQSTYFITNDGSCHIYTTQVWMDLIFTKSSYWKNYFDLHFHLNSNWFITPVIAGLSCFFSPVFVEKILASLYLISFFLASHLVVNELNPKNKMLAILPLIFSFHLVFCRGFYNFSFSISLLLLGIYFLMQYFKNEKGLWKLSIVLIILFFTHLTGLILFFIFALFYFIFFSFETKTFSFKNGLKLLMAFVPSLFLLLHYLISNEANSIPSDKDFETLKTLFLKLSALVIFSASEQKYTSLLVNLIGFFVAISLLRKWKNGNVNRMDSFLFLAIICLYFYVYQPMEIFGGSMIPERIQWLPFFFISFWCLQFEWNKIVQLLWVVALFYIQFNLFKIRKPFYGKMDESYSEIHSFNKTINPSKTLLSLCFQSCGLDTEHKPISDFTRTFRHTFANLSSEKKCFVLDNYQALYNYFPINFKKNQNPYLFLGDGNLDKFDSEQPYVDIESYENNTGHKIDYLIEYFYPNQVDSNFVNFEKYLNQKFYLVKETDHKLAKLFARKNGG